MRCVALIISIAASALASPAALAQHNTWAVYGGGPDAIRYSSLAQINRGNVRQLKVAWTFDASDSIPSSELEVNPIVVDGVLYATTVRHHVIALNAATGELIWRFDPYNGRKVRGGGGRTRGVMYWADSQGQGGRVFVGVQQFLYALDAKTGRVVETFGSQGRIDLRDGLRNGERYMISLGTPGVVYKDLLILGSRNAESLPTGPGDVRAFDVRTGALRWTFHTIPRPGQFGYETWPRDAWRYTGAANAWAGLSLDTARGLVFVPLGSAADDYYGANRVGDNLFANSLVVLKAETGERVWHYQFVKHDVWDRDLPAQPSLVRVRRGGREIDAVAQIAKSGHVWLFDRVSGAPLWPIEYRRYPKSDVDGEVTADSQPLPTMPAPFARQSFGVDSVTTRTEGARLAVLERLRGMRYGGQFVPPSLEGTVVFPGLDGGGEWGGAAFDPATGVLYVNSNEQAWWVRLVPNVVAAGAVDGRQLYEGNCASCHGADFKGVPPAFPSLVGVFDRLTASEVRAIMLDGAGRMPGFAHLSGDALGAIQRYVQTRELSPVVLSGAPGTTPVTQKYRVQLDRFLDPDGYPAVKPPWGTLNAIDLNTGKYLWKIPFGSYPQLEDKTTGSENYGGPVVTAGGLLFIGASNFDRRMRAFDKATGELLWEYEMPGSGNATPSVYEVNGRQFVVIAASHGKSRTQGPSMYVAFTLPQ